MSTEIAPGRAFNNPFISLRHKNFKYYWLGMCVSLIGTWMQNMAQPWLAYTLTQSPLLLSLVGTLQFTPVLLFSLFAGVIVDKYPKKNILFFTQSASLLVTLILGILVWLGHIQYWHILMLALCLGMVNTLDMPARQSFVIELVGKEDLMNAIALNSSVFNIARIAGPALAGIIMGYMGIAMCFLLNSLSFAAVLISLMFIRTADVERKGKDNGRVLADIQEGLKYIWNDHILSGIVLLIAIVGTFAMNFNVLIPVFAQEVLHQQELGFGLLMSCMGIGSFLGAMTVAVFSKSGPSRSVLLVVPLFISVFLILTGCSQSYAMTAMFLALTGFFFVNFSSTANSALQLNCTDEYRGRVMSVYALVFVGSTPLGNLYSGFVAEHLGARLGFAACGLMILLFFLLLFIIHWYKSNKRS